VGHGEKGRFAERMRGKECRESLKGDLLWHHQGGRKKPTSEELQYLRERFKGDQERGRFCLIGGGWERESEGRVERQRKVSRGTPMIGAFVCGKGPP